MPNQVSVEDNEADSGLNYSLGTKEKKYSVSGHFRSETHTM